MSYDYCPICGSRDLEEVSHTSYGSTIFECEDCGYEVEVDDDLIGYDTSWGWQDAVDEEKKGGDKMLRYIDCEECNSSGIKECPACGGTGENNDGERCYGCDGLGDIACSHCSGSGRVAVEINDEYAAMGW